MPNIVEQQDLLKGLPDASIAKLMQSPTGQIPTFLVAAEAQRRASIRQQFAPQANKESVVDQLTKHLTRVPENVKPGMGTTPPVPPTPQMAGVAALQQRQAIQQAAQQPQQAMADGGRVQRFAGGGVPAGWNVKSMASQVAPVQATPVFDPQLGWVYPDGSPAPAPSNASAFDPHAVHSFPEILGGMFGIPHISIPQTGQATGSPRAGNYKILPPGVPMSANPSVPQDLQPDAGQPPTTQGADASETPMSDYRPSPDDNHPYYEHGKITMTPKGPPSLEDQIRDAYAPQQISNWEKAMPWFKAAAQFLDPSKTTAQSIGAAAEQFGGGEAAIAQQARQQGVDQKKAILDYHVQMAQNQNAFALKKMELSAAAGDKVSNYYLQIANHISDARIKIETNPNLQGQDDVKAKLLSALDQQEAQNTAQWQYHVQNNLGINVAGVAPTGP